MPKRPGRERGVEYDRFGRPVEGITTTESFTVAEEDTATEAQLDFDAETEDE